MKKLWRFILVFALVFAIALVTLYAVVAAGYLAVSFAAWKWVLTENWVENFAFVSRLIVITSLWLTIRHMFGDGLNDWNR